jgi:hypothetical protein
MRVASGSWRARCALARGFKFSGRWYLGRVFGVDTPQLWDEHLAVTRVVADHLVTAFDRMIARGVARADAQRSILAGVRACFAEELGVAPRGGFAAGLADGQVLSGLRLVAAEVVELQRAAELDWSRVQPRIFGALFQASMDRGRRHALGAHFTEDADIARVVVPTIVRPWQARVQGARSEAELRALWGELAGFRVLDPACGSGDFLHVAYRELLGVERVLLARLGVTGPSRVSVRNCLGIDCDPFVVALAKLTLWAGERLLCRGSTLTPDDLDANFCVGDALFVAWPTAEVIVGNPPFQAKNKMQAEYGAAYVRALRGRFPEVSGLADYCVYWFRRAHDALPPGGRAGLVGTNTIRQNSSRAGGLAYIVASGTIVEAVASKVWPGAAAVHVSIVSWIKQVGVPGAKILSWQAGDQADSPWQQVELAHIGASLSPEVEVGAAQVLAVNRQAGVCYQGQTHGHAGFLVSAAEAAAAVAADRRCAEVLFPLLVGEELLGRRGGSPGRYVIDFGDRTEAAARGYPALFVRVEARVLPARQAALRAEEARNGALEGAGARVNRHHAHFHEQWWRLSWRRGELLAALAGRSRYVVCARVSRWPVFEFVDAGVRPGDSLVVFALEDDYSFGVLQSSAHWAWWTARCSTLKRDHRYTSRTVFDSFPWPQEASAGQVLRIAAAGRELRAIRARLAATLGLPRRGLYRGLGEPRMAALREAHAELDRAVLAAYAMRETELLSGLLGQNLRLAECAARGGVVVGPGLCALGLGLEVGAACRSEDRLGRDRGGPSTARSSTVHDIVPRT